MATTWPRRRAGCSTRVFLAGTCGLRYPFLYHICILVYVTYEYHAYLRNGHTFTRNAPNISPCGASPTHLPLPPASLSTTSPSLIIFPYVTETIIENGRSPLLSKPLRNPSVSVRKKNVPAPEPPVPATTSISPSPPLPPPSPSSTDKSEPTATGPIVANPPKYVWVDPKGRTIRESGATTGNFTLPPKEDHSWTKAQFDTHSSHLWSRVNPGLIKDYMGAPPSTMKHHFPEHPEDKQKDFEHHLKKTDYSEYTEARAKYAIPAGVSGGGGGGGKADNIFRVPGKCVERFDLFPEPDGGSKANMVAYSTSTKFWETVLNKKTY